MQDIFVVICQKHMNKSLKFSDIVVYDGIITTYAILLILLDPDDLIEGKIRLATKEEIEIYNNRPK